MIFSLYIFDRHCDIVYYQDWHRTSPLKRAKPNDLPQAISPLVSSPLPTQPPTAHSSSRARSAGTASGLNAFSSGGILVADAERRAGDTLAGEAGRNTAVKGTGGKALPFDEEAKLVYGVVLSLRNMVKKLTGSPFQNFQTYTTPSYSMHLFEPPTSLKFILLTSPGVDGSLVRTALRAMWGPDGAYGIWVVANPEKNKEGGVKEGLDCEQFRTMVDQQMRSLSFFQN